ncbi:3-methyladenine DNA glycosylase [Spathaspora passalidarum NRRL Y-27907]|uniref:3-methyladenine DNA glycosylase n=1 Tax=Spathaspora passalidarum (strain NRRL Y-27907 / 11-Y1) TaxID=619300 RepID=G3AKH0_SPAPN|nr:3-methyladenine DNA glycosylase [Spathaspora passalidarum NRRL Y-27907]EGW32927.1 3-methyladenine DNA glycosylase [Spathaspora passalidarum NRRL Y-27907]
MVAVTRAKSTTPGSVNKILTTNTVKNVIVKKTVVKKKTVIKKKPALTKTRSDLEDLLQDVSIPDDLALPEEYVAYHTPEFISGIEHILQVDRSLYPAIVHANFPRFSKTESDKPKDVICHYWYSLIASVISQQVSGASARAIEARFKALFNGEKPTPEITLKFSFDQLRSAGLSNMKAKYVESISQAFADPNCKLTHLEFYENSSLEEIVDELVKLKGIGVWSAKMFSIFTLGEMDVFAEDDLGIARGMAKYLTRRPDLMKEIKQACADDEAIQVWLKRKAKFAKNDSKRNWNPVHDAYVEFASRKFAPHRTALMMIMWRLGSTNIEVLEKLDE